MSKKLVLAVLDGWGVGKQEAANPLSVAKLPTTQYLKTHYPYGTLQSSGIAVGLPWGEVGNSEVGHLTIGAGKVIYQHYPRITLAIQNGEFFKNPVFAKAFEHAQSSGSAVHIAGLLTEGSTHASFEHLEALITYAHQAGVKQLYLHLFADGKDSKPRSVRQLLTRLKEVTEREGLGVLASLSGRHFALDRDSHWDRTEQAYRVMVATTPSQQNLEQAIDAAYAQGINDEAFPPITVGTEAHPVSDNDALIFIDFREDSIRQIVQAFTTPGFAGFPTQKFNNLFVVTMTEYSKTFALPVAFPSEDVTMPLGKVLSQAGKKQLLLAETEKYAHVSYFFNGFRDEPFEGQVKKLIPSNNVDSHAQIPEMKAVEIADTVLSALAGSEFDVVIVNFANADMVAHTGNYDATILAAEAVDAQLGRIVKAVEERGDYLVVTADHGNAEVVLDTMTGSIETSHDPNPVPLYICAPELKRSKTPEEAAQSEREVSGILSDVAPTVLELLGIPKPAEMTGESLIRAVE